MSAVALGSAVLMGLFGGIHCVLMCGGIVGVLSAATGRTSDGTGASRMKLMLAFNAGRISTYAMLGGAAGALSAVALDVASLSAGPVALEVLAAAVMIGTGLYLAGLLPRLAAGARGGSAIGAAFGRALGRVRGVKSPFAAFAVGLLWGLLPCGLVYAALALSLTSGGAGGGGMVMAAFGLGTVPALLAVGGLAEGARRLARMPRIRHAAGLLVALSGVVHLGMAVMRAGLVPTDDPDAPPPCHASR